MSKKRIEKYIPKAIEELDGYFLTQIKYLYPEIPEHTIPSAYNGYISSFGASIIQSGLKPTLALFENSKSNTDKTKKLLVDIILHILDNTNTQTSLLRYVLNSNEDETYLKQKILDISIAIKLSIRTFELTKE